MNFENICEAAKYILSQTHVIPKIAIVLGSGLGDFADELEERIDALEERLAIYESDEEQLESTDQERQEQIAFIREHTEWAINEAISWAEYLNIPLNEEQIAQLREEGSALAERMINDEEYIDYSNSELRDCIEQSITCIKQDIRDKRR